MNTVRETVFGAVYFGVYEATKKFLKENLPNVISGSYSSLLAIQLAGNLTKKKKGLFSKMIGNRMEWKEGRNLLYVYECLSFKVVVRGWRRGLRAIRSML